MTNPWSNTKVGEGNRHYVHRYWALCEYRAIKMVYFIIIIFIIAIIIIAIIIIIRINLQYIIHPSRNILSCAGCCYPCSGSIRRVHRRTNSHVVARDRIIRLQALRYQAARVPSAVSHRQQHGDDDDVSVLQLHDNYRRPVRRGGGQVSTQRSRHDYI